MIFLFTDFGWSGPYVGEMKAVLVRELPGADIIDLMHDAPAFNPKASAYLLAALSKQFRPGDACLGVIDPGVGDNRRRVIFVEADGIHYIGPDNGLFAVVARTAKQVSCREVLWRPQELSASFHGRDLFAPVVSQLYREDKIESRTLPVATLVGADFPEQLNQVIYVDHYGNAITGMVAARYPADMVLTIGDRQLAYARTFSDVAAGELFWYENSMGLVEIAANGANAAGLLNLEIGSEVSTN